DPLAALREAVRIARFVVVEVPTEKVLYSFIKAKVLLRPYASIAEAGHVQFWSPSSIARFLTQDAGMEILEHYRDLLDEEADSPSQRAPGAKPFVKHILRSALPASLYSRLLTTHATFLCRRWNAGSRWPVADPSTMGTLSHENGRRIAVSTERYVHSLVPQTAGRIRRHHVCSPLPVGIYPLRIGNLQYLRL